MKDFTLTMGVSRTEHSIQLNVKANSYDDAGNLGEALCDLMPCRRVYDHKNNRHVDASWWCEVHEFVEDIPPPEAE